MGTSDLSMPHFALNSQTLKFPLHVLPDGDTSTITSATTTPMSKRSAQSSPDKSTFGNSFGEGTGDSFRRAPSGGMNNRP